VTVLASAGTDAPGTLGFLVVFGMAVILFFVFRSMARHLRKVSGSAGPADGQAASGQNGSAQSSAADGPAADQSGLGTDGTRNGSGDRGGSF
jgi:hypothetical protein